MIAIKKITFNVLADKVLLDFLTIYLYIIDSFIISYQNSKEKVLLLLFLISFILYMNSLANGLFGYS
jgi:hypothetical protein